NFPMATSALVADALPDTLPPDFVERDDQNSSRGLGGSSAGREGAAADIGESVSTPPASEPAPQAACEFAPQFTFDLSRDRASRSVPAYTPEYTFDLTPETEAEPEYPFVRTPESQPAEAFVPRTTPELTFDRRFEPVGGPCAAPPHAVESRVAGSNSSSPVQSSSVTIAPEPVRTSRSR